MTTNRIAQWWAMEHRWNVDCVRYQRGMTPEIRTRIHMLKRAAMWINHSDLKCEVAATKNRSIYA